MGIREARSITGDINTRCLVIMMLLVMNVSRYAQLHRPLDLAILGFVRVYLYHGGYKGKRQGETGTPTRFPSSNKKNRITDEYDHHDFQGSLKGIHKYPSNQVSQKSR